MTSAQLAKAITHMLKSLESRIMGVGADQYDSGNRQALEDKSLDRVLDEAMEEIDDLLVYLAWARIRVQRVRANLQDLT
jgi:hypothetical protein